MNHVYSLREKATEVAKTDPEPPPQSVLQEEVTRGTTQTIASTVPVLTTAKYGKEVCALVDAEFLAIALVNIHSLQHEMLPDNWDIHDYNNTLWKCKQRLSHDYKNRMDSIVSRINYATESELLAFIKEVNTHVVILNNDKFHRPEYRRMCNERPLNLYQMQDRAERYLNETFENAVSRKERLTSDLESLEMEYSIFVPHKVALVGQGPMDPEKDFGLLIDNLIGSCNESQKKKVLNLHNAFEELGYSQEKIYDLLMKFSITETISQLSIQEFKMVNILDLNLSKVKSVKGGTLLDLWHKAVKEDNFKEQDQLDQMRIKHGLCQFAIKNNEPAMRSVILSLVDDIDEQEEVTSFISHPMPNQAELNSVCIRIGELIDVCETISRDDEGFIPIEDWSLCAEAEEFLISTEKYTYYKRRWNPLSIDFIYDKALLLNKDCAICDAVKVRIREWYEGREDDIPIRDQAWTHANKCEDESHARHCKAFELPDWKFSAKFRTSGKNSPNFQKNLEEVVNNGYGALLASQRMTKRFRKVVIHDLRSSPYVIYLSRLLDQEIDKNDQRDMQFFLKVYSLRNVCGFNGDFGYRTEIPDMVAQGPGLGLGTIFETLLNHWKKETSLLDKIKFSVYEAVKMLFVPISFFSETLSTILNYMCDTLFNFLYKIFEPVNASLKDHVQAVIKSILFGIFLISMVVGLMTVAVGFGIFRVLGWVQKDEDCDIDMIAQSKPDPVGLVATVIIALFGLNFVDGEKVRKRCLQLTALVAGGAAVSTLASSALVILPAALQEAILLRFGTQEQKFRNTFDYWRAKAQTVIACSRVQAVVGTKEFEDMLSEVIQEAGSIGKHLKDVEMRTTFFAMMNRIVPIDVIVKQYQYEQAVRNMPFAIHLAGPPGIGKSVIEQHLVREVFQIGPKDTYYKPVASEYWDGYRSAKAVIIEEFLLGDLQKNMTDACEYLSLVSTSQFKPNLASVDSLAVGIKGSTCQPDVVVTINNTTYNVVQGISSQALQRRRQCVIEMIPNQRYQGKDNKIDLVKYNDEEKRSVVWADFKILPAQYSHSQSEPLVLSFAELCEYLRSMYENHRTICEDIMRAYKFENVVEDNPLTILRETMAECHSVPTKSVGIMDMISGALKFVAQGKELHEHTCCGVKHNNVTEDFVCKHCNFWTPCSVVPSKSTIVKEIDVVKGNLTLKMSQISDFFETPYYYVKSISHVPKLAIVATSVAIVAAAWHIYNFMSGKQQEVTFIAQSPRPNKEVKKASYRRANFKTLRQLQAQGPSPMVVPLTVGSESVFAIPLFEKWFLTYGHAVYNKGQCMKEGLKMTVWYLGKLYETITNWDHVRVDPDHDIAAIYFDCKQMPQFPDIRGKFIDEREVEGIDKIPVNLLNPGKNAYAVAFPRRNMSYGCKGERRELDLCLNYMMPTELGDCGSMIRVPSGPMAGTILGIHVAGSTPDAPVQVGACAFVTKQIVENLFADVDDIPTVEMEQQGLNLGALEGLPNCKMIKQISLREAVFLPTKTKLKPSLLEGKLNHPVGKEFPCLSIKDPRAKGQDPVFNGIKDTLMTDHPTVDEDLVKDVFADIYEQYEQHLEWPVGKRQLTFTEACAGVPGKLSSIKVSSSVGYPLIYERTKPGKTDYVWFDEKGKLQYTSYFLELVLKKTEEMETYDKGKPIDHVFIGYLKDEMISKAKLEEMRVRIIYANDLVALVAFRIYYGAVLAAFAQSYVHTPCAIGMNPMSYDMDKVHDYLSKVGKNFIDGDYKSFDKRLHPVFRQYAYETIFKLADSYKVPKNCHQFLYEHEVNSPAQVNDVRFQTYGNHMSGCFYTTIINCLVNEAYFRYIFKRKYPELIFADHVACKFLGDDHLIAISNEIQLTPAEIGIRMKEIGQEYTAAEKGEALREGYKTFVECTFLGVHPVVINGYYSGALKKEILWRAPQITRDKNKSLYQIIEQMVECASQWDEDFFANYLKTINDALLDIGMPTYVPRESWRSLRKTVATRVSGMLFTFATLYSQGVDFIAQGPTPGSATRDQAATSIASVKGITMIPADEEQSQNVSLVSYATVASDAISEQQADIDYGANSQMLRDNITWLDTHARGQVIATYDIPFGILSLGDPNNLQNMPFQRFIYCTTDVDIQFQMNANPFVQGQLIAYFLPMRDVHNPAADWNNMTMNNHVPLAPAENTTGNIHIKFNAHRALNTFAGGLGTETMGRVYVQVGSPLLMNGTLAPVTIQVYSAFSNAKFTIPRPVTLSKSKDLTWGGIPDIEEIDFEKIAMESQGGNVSKNETTNNFVNYGDFAGNVPQENTNRADQTTTQRFDTKVDAPMPMDKPPLGGGSLPLHPVYSSLSKSNGVAPTVHMQFHQSMMHRDHYFLHDPLESRISNIMERLGYLAFFPWLSTTPAGTQLYTVPLNTIFSNIFLGPVFVPLNVALLNKFDFWRADIEFEFIAIKTAYQSGRLNATVAYGAPSVSPVQRNVYMNQVLNFTKETYRQKATVTFNASTNYLRTWKGSNAPNVIQDYSMGTLMVSVLTQLQSNATVVEPLAEIIVGIRFKNFRCFEMNSAIVSSIGFMDPLPTLNVAMEAQGPIEANVPEVEVPADTKEVPSMEMTAQETDLQPLRPCKLELGHKFEYLLSDVHDVVRRYYEIKTTNTSLVKYFARTNYAYMMIRVAPVHPFSTMFVGWNGHLNYRLYFGQCNAPAATNLLVNTAAVSVRVLYPPDYTTGFPSNGLIPDDVYGLTNAMDNVTQAYVAGAVPIDALGNVSMINTGLEVPYQLTPGSGYLDVSVPFSSIFNYNFNLNISNVSGQPWTKPQSSATLIISLRSIGDTQYIDPANWRLYQAVGDDFRYTQFIATSSRIGFVANQYPLGNYRIMGIDNLFTI